MKSGSAPGSGTPGGGAQPAPPGVQAATRLVNSKALMLELNTTLVQIPPALTVTKDCPVAGVWFGFALGLARAALVMEPIGTAPLKNVSVLKVSGEPHRKLMPSGFAVVVNELAR